MAPARLVDRLDDSQQFGQLVDSRSDLPRSDFAFRTLDQLFKRHFVRPAVSETPLAQITHLIAILFFVILRLFRVWQNGNAGEIELPYFAYAAIDPVSTLLMRSIRARHCDKLGETKWQSSPSKSSAPQVKNMSRSNLE